MNTTLQIHYNSLSWDLDKGCALTLVWTILAGRVHICALLFQSPQGASEVQITETLLPKLAARALLSMHLIDGGTSSTSPTPAARP